MNLRAAAFEIFTELTAAGIQAKRTDTGMGLPHAMWLAYMIGKRLNDVDRQNRYLGNIQTILVYERFWTNDKLMERAAAWYKDEFINYGTQAPRGSRRIPML